MKIIKTDQRKEFKNSEDCFAFEYPLGDKDINLAVIELSGRYPEKGLATNLECKELAYVAEGNGIINVDGATTDIQKGDAVLLEIGEKYYWDGNLTMVMACAPAWRPEQHKIIE